MGVVGCLMQDMHQENHANTKTASLRAQPEWLKGLLSYFQHQIKKAEVSSGAGSAPAAGPLSGKSGAQNTVSGTKGTGLALQQDQLRAKTTPRHRVKVAFGYFGSNACRLLSGPGKRKMQNLGTPAKPVQSANDAQAQGRWG